MMIGQLVRRAQVAYHKRATWTAGGHPRDPGIVKMIGGQRESAAGIQITRETIIRYPPLWKGVSLISEMIAKVPVRVFKYVDMDGRRGSEPDGEHPADYLLYRSPNAAEWLTPFNVKRLVQSHALIEGNGYLYVNRLPDGSPESLIPMLPDRTYPIRDGGKLWYVTRVKGENGGSERKLLFPDNVIHIRGLGFDGLSGYPIMDYGLDALGLGLAVQNCGAKFFAQGGTATGILMVPGNIDEEELANLRNSWDKLYSGVQNNTKIMVLEEDRYKYQQLTIDPDKAQSVQTQEIAAIQCANLLRLPAHKLGAKVNTSYNSLEQENQACLDEAYDPWLVQWEEELESKLLTEQQKQDDTHYVEFDRKRLVTPDLRTRVDCHNVRILGGWETPDEARYDLGENPLEDGLGAVIRVPLNTGNAGGDPASTDKGKVPPIPGEDPADDTLSPEDAPVPPKRAKAMEDACKAALTETLVRAIRRISANAKRAAASQGNFLRWLEGMEAEHRAIVEEMLLPIAAIREASGGPAAKAAAVETAGKLFATIRADLLEASGKYTADRFAAGVERETWLGERRWVLAVLN